MFQLEHLEVPDLSNWWSNSTNRPMLPPSLLNLTTQHFPRFSLLDLPNLKYLRLIQLLAPENLTFDPNPNLIELHLDGRFIIDYVLGNLTSFPQLKVLSIIDGLPLSPALSVSTSTLTSLTFSCTLQQFSSLTVTSSSLKSLSACQANVTLATASLESLESGFSTSALPPLRSWMLMLSNGIPGSWDSVICSPLTASTVSLEEFSVSFYPYAQPFSVPPCFRSFTSLTGLRVDKAIINRSFFDNVPKAKISTLYMINFAYPVFISDLYQFPNLETLYIFDLSGALLGSIPENFFLNLPSLSRISLESSGINGTIPWYGWSNLKEVHIEGSFSSWPGIDSAPLAKYIAINSFSLDTIPGDDAFRGANLQMLQTFKLYSSPQRTFEKLTGPVPAFWTMLPNIRYVWLTGNYSGPLPSPIAAPRLESMRIWFTDFSCGSLPEFRIPTHLKYFYGGSRGLAGTIPASWEQNLTIIYTLELSNNFLGGSIPPHLLDHHGLQLTSILLENNLFTGPLWNMSRGAPYSTLTVGQNGFDLCQIPPTLPLNQTIRACSYANVPTCPAGLCSTAWLAACRAMAAPCTTATQPSSIPPNCIAPPPRPSPILPLPVYCPPPRPEGFTCTNGQWVFPYELSVPSISFPPNIGTVIIQGNMTSTGLVVFTGTGTTLEVNGCFNNLGEVVVEIDPEEKPKKVTLLVQKGSNCPTDLSSIQVALKPTKKSCKSAKASSSESTPSSLVLAFTIDSNRCNTKWIVIGCVLGAVVILGVAGVILVQHYRKLKPARKQA